MADLIDFTRGTVTTAGGWQTLEEVVDISGYDQLDVELAVLAITGSPTNVEIAFFTSTQKKPEAGTGSDIPWTEVRARVLTAVGYDTFYMPDAATPILRYLRWKVTFSGGSSPTVTFQVNIMARRKSI